MYNDDIDPKKYGTSYGLPRRSKCGGWYGINALCGSRSGVYNCFGVQLAYAETIRGCRKNTIILGRHGME